MCIFSGRFDAVEDLFLIPNLPSAARRVYSRLCISSRRKNTCILL